MMANRRDRAPGAINASGSAGSAALADPAAGVAQPLAAGRSGAGWRRFAVRFVKRQPLGFAGLVVVVGMLLLGIVAPAIAPYDPVQNNLGQQLRPPGAEHWLGTDQFGRDVWSRLLYGARTALTVGFVSAFVGCCVGAVLGMVGAYFGGKVDLLLERIMDILVSFPLIVLAVAVVAALGAGLGNVIVAVTIPIIPRASRVIRACGLTLREMQYVEAARCLGVKPARIIGLHLLPNTLAPFLVLLSAFLGQTILAESSLSFLGLGVSEPTPAWGLMLRGAGIQFLEQAPWLAIAPGVAISLSVFAFNLLGDALRDALDPRLRL